MHTFDIAVHLVASLANITLMALAVTVFFTLRNIRLRIDTIHDQQRTLLAMAISMDISQSQQQIARLRMTLDALVNSDQFEEAERIKGIIGEREQYLHQQIEFLRKEFSDDCDVKTYSLASEKKTTK
jgi:hypothetical protein